MQQIIKRTKQGSWFLFILRIRNMRTFRKGHMFILRTFICLKLFGFPISRFLDFHISRRCRRHRRRRNGRRANSHSSIWPISQRTQESNTPQGAKSPCCDASEACSSLWIGAQLSLLQEWTWVVNQTLTSVLHSSLVAKLFFLPLRLAESDGITSSLCSACNLLDTTCKLEAALSSKLSKGEYKTWYSL